MTRTLEEIEAEVRRLCGEDPELFEVDRYYPGKTVSIEFANGKHKAWFTAEDGCKSLSLTSRERDLESFFRFIDICRKLDSYIRGET